MTVVEKFVLAMGKYFKESDNMIIEITTRWIEKKNPSVNELEEALEQIKENEDYFPRIKSLRKYFKETPLDKNVVEFHGSKELFFTEWIENKKNFESWKKFRPVHKIQIMDKAGLTNEEKIDIFKRDGSWDRTKPEDGYYWDHILSDSIRQELLRKALTA